MPRHRGRRPQRRGVADGRGTARGARYERGRVGAAVGGGADRSAWQAGRIAPLAGTTTARELVRVLAYPKFRLTAPEQEDLLADDLPWLTVVRIPDPPPAVPACRDPFDVPFLHLAVAGKARALVTGDRALLALAGSRGLCPVTTPDAFAAGL